MQEKLKAVAELQKVDMEVAAAKKAADVYPRQVAEHEKTLAAARSLVEAERSKLTDLEREKQTLEQNIVDEKDKVKKWEQRLAEQRSTREYSALAREIDIAKKANLTMSEQVVELGKQIAAQREVVKAQEQEYAARQDNVGGQIAELKAKIGAFQGELKGFEERRAAAAAKVDRTLLNRYDQVRKKRMPALVAVLFPGTCQGCHMNVPPQLYNTLRTTAGTDVCPSCHRIIYAGEALDLTT